MASTLPELEFRTAAEWRRWLARHHGQHAGVWLVFRKKHTGLKSIPYEDAVNEALCFGWIDSLVRRLDEDCYVRKFTPRREGSVWSDINRRRWAALEKAGKLTAAGRRAAPTGKRYDPVVKILAEVEKLPEYIERAFRRNKKAWAFFESLPPNARRMFVLWIHTAKREETRQKRIRESIRHLERGERLGLK